MWHAWRQGQVRVGLSQVAVSTSALQISRMDDVAAVHSEWLLPHLCEFDGTSNIQTSCYNSSLSEGKFQHKSTAKIFGFEYACLPVTFIQGVPLFPSTTREGLLELSLFHSRWHPSCPCLFFSLVTPCWLHSTSQSVFTVHESPHTVPHLELVALLAALLQLLHIILGKKRRKVGCVVIKCSSSALTWKSCRRVLKSFTK